jgi:peroxiredoxin
MLKRYLVLLCFAALLYGQSRIELLRRAANFYSDQSSFDVKGSATAKIPGTSWQITYDSETEAAQPQFIPVGPRGASLQAVTTVGNFRHTRAIADANDPYPSGGFSAPPFGQYETLARRLLDAQRIGVETVTYQGHDYRCDVVDAVYDESPELKPNSRSSHRKIYIDPDTLWVLKEIQPDSNVGEWTFVVASATFNRPPSDALIQALQKSANRRKTRPEWQGRSAPDLTLNDLFGNRVGLADLHGRPVLLDFWASYCGPCKRATAFSEQLANTYRQAGLVVWSVTRDTPDDARSWLNFNHLTLPVLLDGDGAAFKAFQVEGVPVVILIDEQGKVVEYWEGMDDQSQVQTAVEEIVNRHR